MMEDRFEQDRKDRWSTGIYEIGEDRLVLMGGGDFYENGDSEPDDDTRQKARELAEKYGMEIVSSSGGWWGYSEYTPDPGDVSIFTWRPI